MHLDHTDTLLPSAGFSSRLCGVSASWERVDLIGCISVEGQSLLQQVAALEGGQVFSPAELRGVASALAVSSAHDTPPRVGGDIRVAGKLLNQLVLQVDILMSVSSDEGEGLGVGIDVTVDSLARTASNLLNPDLSQVWVGVVEGVEFDSEALLFALEAFARTSSRYLRSVSSSLKELSQQNFRLVTTQPSLSHDPTNRSHDAIILTFNESTATISLGADTPVSSVTYGLFPTLGDLLPLRGSFNISNMVVATPILSVQAADLEGSEVTTVAVNMTMQFDDPVERLDLVGGAICVSWGVR